MAYVPTDWVDNVTPLDEAHLDHIEQGIVTLDGRATTLDGQVATLNGQVATKVDKDSVVVAATRIVASKLLVGDAQPAFRLDGNGKLSWGLGGASAVDANLYRSGVATLKTDGALQVGTDVMVNASGAGGRLFFTVDTSLFRDSAGVVKADGALFARDEIAARVGTASQVGIGDLGGNAGIFFGAGADASLYRSGANELTTAARFIVSGGDVRIGGAAGGITINNDSNLYRAGAGSLKTDGALLVGTDLIVDKSGVGSRLYFGTGFDANIYRNAASSLKTDGAFIVAGAFTPGSIVMPYTTYVPTLTAVTANPNLGAAPTQFGRYIQVGKLVHCYGMIAFGTGSTPGTGAYRVSLPVAANLGATQLIEGTYRASGPTVNLGYCRFPTGIATAVELIYLAGYPTGASTIVGDALPWVWADTHNIRWNITYEAA